MILSHDGNKPSINAGSCAVPNTTICGDVRIASGCRIVFDACVIADGRPTTLGENCIVMENEVLRSTDEHELRAGGNCLIGPRAHVGCTIEDDVFIATG